MVVQALRAAIQGGSITPEAMQGLRPHLKVGPDKLALLLRFQLGVCAQVRY
jgi:hypothetical protein